MPEERNHHIEIERIIESLHANIVVGHDNTGQFISDVYASDLMSDVLAYGKSGSILITGLNSIQAAISAYMAEFKGIIFIRNKIPDKEIKDFAKEKGLAILTTSADMYETCVKIATIEGEVHPAVDFVESRKKAENITSYTFDIDGRDFANAGLVSTQIKAILKSIGYDHQVIRRAAISTYESEMNVVMHAKKAKVTLKASDQEIYIIIADEGKGIKDIEQAMKEGYSTATEEQRAMGFGAGMGLPNIRKNSDKMNIESKVNEGTRIETMFYVK